MNYKLRKFLIGLVLVFFLFLTTVSFVFAQNIEEQVKVKAVVGKYRLVLMGYTSPRAVVRVTMGANLDETTIARDDGIFLFYDIWMPATPSEPCFIATDVNGVSSALLCLAAPAKEDTSIFDIYLPPTLTLETDKVAYNSTVAARGMTTPKSEVEIYLFKKDVKGMVAGAWAKQAPRVKILSNDTGNFEFNLPSNVRTTYRVFVGSRFADFMSPKSNTLAYWVIKALVWTAIIIAISLGILSVILLLYLIKRKRKIALPCIGD